MAGRVDRYRNLKLNSLLLNSSVYYLYQAVQSPVFFRVLQLERISLRNAASPLQLLSNTLSHTVKANPLLSSFSDQKILVNRELKLPSGFSCLSKMPCSAKLTPLKTQKMRNLGINQQNLNCDPLEVSVPGITGILSR